MTQAPSFSIILGMVDELRESLGLIENAVEEALNQAQAEQRKREAGTYTTPIEIMQMRLEEAYEVFILHVMKEVESLKAEFYSTRTPEETAVEVLSVGFHNYGLAGHPLWILTFPQKNMTKNYPLKNSTEMLKDIREHLGLKSPAFVFDNTISKIYAAAQPVKKVMA